LIRVYAVPENERRAMADAIDQTDAGVGPSTDVDTVPTEESIEADMNTVSWEDGDDDGAEAEPVTEAATEETDEAEEDSDDAVESEDTTEDEVEPQTTEPEEDSTTSKDDEERKRHNQEMAQRRIQEREAKRQKQAEDQDNYLKEAEDATDQALRQLQVDAYNNRVMMVTNQVQSDVISARDSIDLFTSKDPIVRESMLKALDDFETYHIKKDEYGNMTGVTADVRQYLHAKADEIRTLTSIGARQQTEKKKAQQSRTTTPPAKSPPRAKVDPDMEAFDSVANSY
jgi:hypothetical protein